VAAGVVVAFAALIAAVIAGAIALGKFAGHVRESASAALEAKRQYAMTTPAIAAVLSQKEVMDLAESSRRGQMLASTAQTELAAYGRWQEGTRNIEVVGQVIGSYVKIAMTDALRTLLEPIEKIARWIAKRFGLLDEDNPILMNMLLKSLNVMRRDQMEETMGSGWYRWPRTKPPKPINMGPGEK
jgi:hypothetical protein